MKAIFLELIEKTTETLGSTAPNPAVGAAALDRSGSVISQQFHAGAGKPHAEALVIEDCRTRGILDQVHTLLVTLEPCNHTGRTPPCTRAILDAGIRRVYFAAQDLNPKVRGNGQATLRAAGVDCAIFPDEEVQAAGRHLIRAFALWSRTARPWVTVKRAFNTEGRMIPPAAQKTFTSPESLLLAHQLRKRADAIITGSETVLKDLPLFTVRHLPDHVAKTRDLVVLDRRGRVRREAPEWIRQAETSGFRVHVLESFEKSLYFLGTQGVLEVLVEAGPALSGSVLNTELWDESITIQAVAGAPDRVATLLRQPV